MKCPIYVIFYIYFILNWPASVISDDLDIYEEGLYRQDDQVVILGGKNFNSKVYGQNHAWLLQFYNSFCGHCRAFAPKYKSLAKELLSWKNIIRLGVVDCNVEENNDICRQFEVLAYPSLRYLHEHYAKGNTNIGERLPTVDTAEKVKADLLKRMQTEQESNRLKHVPSLALNPYRNYQNVFSDVPENIIYKFLIFEKDNDTIGTEIILHTYDYKQVNIKRVLDSSELAKIANIRTSPSLVVLDSKLSVTKLRPASLTAKSFLRAIDSYLKSKNYNFPIRNITSYETNENDVSNKGLVHSDVVYYSDLEKTIKTTLQIEVVRYKIISGERLQALLDYLDVLLVNFPFRGNGKRYIFALRNNIAFRKQWNGEDLYEMIKKMEETYQPVYFSEPEYVGCKGSSSNFRGYTCGLWHLFHTLTVNAVKFGNEGPKVLRAMHGYVKNFFGCTECSEHFQSMAERNKLFSVKDNDKAVIWLWVSHNEVNLRLAGDSTEDPIFPKIQFPRSDRCPDCRLVRGAWNLSAVYNYLLQMYSAENIKENTLKTYASPASSPFSEVDIGMLSLLYIFSFVIIILVLKSFLTKRFYRKRVYKHDGLGKV